MKKIVLIAMLLLMAGCASSSEDAQSLFDRLEFEDDESGTVRITGDVNLGGNPFFQTTVHVDYEKTKTAPGEEQQNDG